MLDAKVSLRTLHALVKEAREHEEGRGLIDIPLKDVVAAKRVWWYNYHGNFKTEIAPTLIPIALVFGSTPDYAGVLCAGRGVHLKIAVLPFLVLGKGVFALWWVHYSRNKVDTYLICALRGERQ